MSPDNASNLFGGADEPALRTVSRAQLIDAYAAELSARPPVSSCAGDDDRAKANCQRFADRDIGRLYTAAAKAGIEIKLVPTAKNENKTTTGANAGRTGQR